MKEFNIYVIAIENEKYRKAISTLLMAEGRQGAYKLACMKDNFGSTALHYAVSIEDIVRLADR